MVFKNEKGEKRRGREGERVRGGGGRRGREGERVRRGGGREHHKRKNQADWW